MSIYFICYELVIVVAVNLINGNPVGIILVISVIVGCRQSQNDIYILFHTIIDLRLIDLFID